MSQVALGNVTIDLERYEVRVDVRPVSLTFMEFELLLQLARKPGRVITRDELLHAVWDGRAAVDGDTLTVHISRLRKKISLSRPWHIKTLRRRGYMLSDDDDDQPQETTGDTQSGTETEGGKDQ
jgi:two-component system alkaline phosphatase synthesis response regulator PhoP